MEELSLKGMPTDDPLKRIATDADLRVLHLAMLPAPRIRVKGEVNTDLVVAMAKLQQADTLQEAIRFLSAREKLTVLGSTEGIDRLVRLAQTRHAAQ